MINSDRAFFLSDHSIYLLSKQGSTKLEKIFYDRYARHFTTIQNDPLRAGYLLTLNEKVVHGEA